MVQEIGVTDGTEINEIIGAISHSHAHIKKAIRWPKWLLRNLSTPVLLCVGFHIH
jgi:hypothetical protein